MLIQMDLVSIEHNTMLSQSNNQAVCVKIDFSFVPGYIHIEGKTDLKSGVTSELVINIESLTNYLAITP